MLLVVRWAGIYTAAPRHPHAHVLEMPVLTQGQLGFADDNKCLQWSVYYLAAAASYWAI